jgi:hypothetical protein
LFIAAGVLADFAAARFVKASAQRPLADEDEFDDSDLGVNDLATDRAPTLTDEVDDEAPLPGGP